jgi:hypothetical protein
MFGRKVWRCEAECRGAKQSFGGGVWRRSLNINFCNIYGYCCIKKIEAEFVARGADLVGWGEVSLLEAKFFGNFSLRAVLSIGS